MDFPIKFKENLKRNTLFLAIFFFGLALGNFITNFGLLLSSMIIFLVGFIVGKW